MGGAHGAYFQQLQFALAEAGLYRPTLVLDRQRLDENTVRLIQHLNGNFDYRIVGKSLPSLPLIERVRAATASNRVMVFHQPFLNLLAAKMPDADLLMGKPMPVQMAQRFYQYQVGQSDFSPEHQLQWLIDSPQRLKEYRQLAEARQQPMQLNFELDVGLHRGGFKKASELARCIADVQGHPLLQFSGFMGYEAHVSKMPGVVGGPEKAMAQAMGFYRECVAAAKTVLKDQWNPATLTLNAGGSSTYQMYQPQMQGSAAPCNEIATGSALVMPTDFDVPSLADHLPAAFIATPVLKALDSTEVPGLEGASGAIAAWDVNTERTFFTYGGYWKARPESPAGLQNNGLYGRSTNQEMLNGSRNVKLAQGDFVFLRPSQSEFVFLQFGDIAVFDGRQISETWPVFQQGA
ncbi:DSD1 family PLP-dependent enzyme [Spongiibacter sp. KMU-158]|uniref:DSD1 family PLP-dependent enzyme n=2 Tax=Spongiibacter pelagi TaxID=2760804 RepID=A0A927C1E1_9GAMM|nr:DSD1 family PLP-dependent enzyme [Spongiibacter pelagi]